MLNVVSPNRVDKHAFVCSSGYSNKLADYTHESVCLLTFSVLLLTMNGSVIL